MQALKFQNRKEINFVDGENKHIIATLLKAVPEALHQGKDLAPFFTKKSTSKIDVARKAWHYGKHKIRYQVDEFGTQKIQLPSALLHSQTGDCKSLTLLMVAILYNALPGTPIYIRFASYDKTNPTPTHVYCYIIVNGQQITVDPVYFDFNKEKPYFYNQDYNVMEISTVAGFDDVEVGKINLFKKAKDKAKQVVDKKIEKKKKQFGKLKKVALAGPRGSFLLLVKINARGLANKLKRAPADKVKKIWNALGGNFDKLLKAVEVGSKKKAFLGEKVNQVEGLEGIGSVVAVSTLLVSAAGVIAALAPVLKSIESAKAKKEGEPGLEEITKETAENGGDLSIPRGQVADGEPGSGREGGAGGGFDFSLSNPLLLGGIAVGAYLLMKKGKK